MTSESIRNEKISTIFFKSFLKNYIMQDNLWKALLSEFLAVFVLVFIGAGAVALTVQQGSQPGSYIASALAFGLALAAVIYTFGSYSGAHANPAVSFGFAVSGRMNWGLMLAYWIVQLLGGIAAAALIAYIFGTASGVGASIGSLTNTDAWKAVLLEAILTFFLVIVVLFVTQNPMLAVASGFAIGLVLTFDMLAGAPLTGASMNPARSLGPALFSSNMGTYWIYVVGPLLGALVAALVYKLFTTDFSCCVKRDACGKPIKDECGNTLKECKRPLVDKCGKQVKNCSGPVYDTYIKHDRKLTHLQENPVTYLSNAAGYDPRYVKQELNHFVEKVHGHEVPTPKSMPTPTGQSAVRMSNFKIQETPSPIRQQMPQIIPQSQMNGQIPQVSQLSQQIPNSRMSPGTFQIPNLPGPF